MSSYGREAEASPSAGYSNDNWIKLAVPVSVVLSRLNGNQRELGGETPAGLIAQPGGQEGAIGIEVGGADGGVTVVAYRSDFLPLTPGTDEGEVTEDRTVTYSVSGG